MKPLSCSLFVLLAAIVALAGCATPYQTAPKSIALVDGAKGLENFDRVATANWAAADGVIQADQGGKEWAYLVSKDSYRDFVINAEFWASDDANSGIFIRCNDPTKITSTSCYEVNIFDTRPDPSYGTAAIVNVAKVSPMPKAGGKWNTFEITAKGSRLIVIFNGQKTVDVEDGKLSEGRIALQWGSGVIKFRKVQVTPL